MLKFNEKTNILTVTLPSGKTQDQLIDLVNKDLDNLIDSRIIFGHDVKIDGRITTGMALSMGHLLAHVTNSVSIFDPKMNKFILAIKH